MKNLWGILMIMCLAVVFIFGITVVSTELFSKGSLSRDSIKLLNTTNPIIADYYNSVQGNFSADSINVDANPDLNGISEYFQEFKTFQNKYDQLKGALKTIYILPDWMLEIIPFVDRNDLNIFINLYRSIVWVLIILIFIKVLGGRSVD